MANLYKLKTLIPLVELEQECQQQIYNALELEFLKILAVMPDAHTGYHLPIGGVALLDNVISPSYVGYDIGCGMCCVVTEIQEASKIPEKEKIRIFNQIMRDIPTGKKARKESLDYTEFKSASGDKALNKQVNDKLFSSLGTLGSGNHFIELGYDLNDRLTLTIHSGSRNPGHTIATYYMHKAESEDKNLPNGFLNLDGDFGQQYLQDLLFSQQYALDNRLQIINEILVILGLNPSKYKGHIINENHNHAILLDNGEVLHRKGATPADEGQLGVIPGNMRDGVYITEGLGNTEYLSSASHGAGRKMSRRKAKDSLDYTKFKDQMNGVVCNTDKNLLDEAPDAYKKIDTVIKYQDKIVVNIIDYVKPLINIKAAEDDYREKRRKKKELKQAREQARKEKR
jgi:tRNA-splicing ligase RtcB